MTFYRETRVNADMELDEESGVLRYTPKTTITFLPEESIGDPKKINVTMPNIALMVNIQKWQYLKERKIKNSFILFNRVVRDVKYFDIN